MQIPQRDKHVYLKDDCPFCFFDETQKYAEEGNYFMRIANLYKCVLLNSQVVLYGQGKGGFGVSGLSANLKEMEKGELKNIKTAKKLKIINALEYNFLVCFSLLKYFQYFQKNK